MSAIFDGLTSSGAVQVCECVVILKNLKDVSWAGAKSMMADTGFLKGLVEFDKDSLSDKQVYPSWSSQALRLCHSVQFSTLLCMMCRYVESFQTSQFAHSGANWHYALSQVWLKIPAQLTSCQHVAPLFACRVIYTLLAYLGEEGA